MQIKILSLVLAVFLTQVSRADTVSKPVVIDNGTYGQSRLPGIQFLNNSVILSGIVDPSVTAVDATIGSLYLNNVNSITYQKGDNGLTTSWTALGTGGGGGGAPTGPAGGSLSGSYPNPGLKLTGTAGTYTKVTFDAQGRETSGTTLSAGDIPSLLASKISDFVTAVAAAIGYTPEDVANKDNGALSNSATTYPTSHGVTVALATKEPVITAATANEYYRGDKTFQTLNTGVVPETSNLYYTTARFSTDFAGKSTTDLIEGTQQYFTAARARTAVITSSITSGDTTHSPDGDSVFNALAAIPTPSPISGNPSTVAAFSTGGTLSSLPYFGYNDSAAAVDLLFASPVLSITNDFRGLNLNPSGTVGGNFYGLLTSSSSTITGGFTGLTISSSGGIGSNFVAANITNTGPVGGNFSVAGVTNSGVVTSNFNGYSISNAANVGGNLSMLDFSNQAGHTVTGDAQFIHVTSDSAISGNEVLANLHSSAVTTGNKVGATIQFQGSAASVTGIDIDLNAVTSPNIKTGVSVASGALHVGYDVSTGDVTPSPFGSVHNLGGSLTIASGHPLLATPLFLNNLGFQIGFADDATSDNTLGAGDSLGQSIMAFVNQVAGANGKTLDTLNYSFLGGSNSDASTGHINELNIYRGVGVLNAGGGLTVGTQRMFYVDPGFDGALGTNKFGFINASSSNNWMKGSLVLGGTTGALSSADVLEVTGDTKLTGALTVTGIASLGNGSTATTQAASDNSTKISTTAYADNAASSAAAAAIVQTIINGDTTHASSSDALFDALALKAPLASPVLTGNPTAPTQSAGDNSTKIATTAYSDAAATSASSALLTTTITNGDTTHAPNGDSVFDALALKFNTSSFTDAAVTGKLITGFSSGAGALAGTDTILQAINKLDGNIAAVSSGITSINGDGIASGPGAATLTLATVATPGTSTKVTYNAKGLVTSGTTLASSDIPALDFSKITTGTVPVSQGGTNKTSYTAGNVVYAGASGTSLTEDGTSAFTYDAANKRLAINGAGTGKLNATVTSGSDNAITGFCTGTTGNCVSIQNQAGYSAQFTNAANSAVTGATIGGAFSRGTLAARTQSLAGDQLFSLSAQGYTGSAFSAGLSSAISFVATENTGATSAGSQLVFSTTPNTTLVPVPRVTIGQSGLVNIAGLTASVPVFTDASKNLISGTQTGTGTQAVMSASPTLTGTPLTPTAAPGTNTTQIASTAFVTAAVVAAGGTPATVTITGNTTLASTTKIYAANTTGGTFTVTLPAAASNNGVSFIVKDITFGGASVSVARTGADTIEGATSDTIAAGEGRTYFSDGSNWYLAN